MTLKLIFALLLGASMVFDGIRRLNAEYKGRNKKAFRQICEVLAGMTIFIAGIINLLK